MRRRRFTLEDVVLGADETGLRRFVDALRAEPADPRVTGAAGEALRHLLPVALIRRYRLSGHGDLLDAAISILQDRARAADIAADELSSVQADLAAALLLRYQRTGKAAPLEEAIAAGQASLASPVSGDERAGRLGNVAHLLAIRAAGYNAAGDLDRSIDHLERAVRVDGAGPAKLAECWSNLAGALRDKFRRDRDTDALGRAVAALREAVRLAPGDSTLERDNRVNLAGAERDHAVATRDIAELHTANSDIETAIAELPPDDPALAGYLHSLGRGHLEMHRLTGDPGDLRRARAALRDALARTGTDQQSHASIARSLADALLADGRSTEALVLLDMVTHHASAPAAVRFDAALGAGQARLGDGDPRAALPSWATAVGLLPVIAWRGSSYRDREAAVGRSSGTAGSAAACAVAAGDPARAVVMVETGRGVLWRHLLDARADLEALRVARPDLADRLEAAMAVLDATHHR